MRSRIYAKVPVVALIVCCCSPVNDENPLRGPYLGETPPGNTPTVFAPGFLSTAINEGKPAFLPDASEIYFHVTFERDHGVDAAIAVTRQIDGEWIRPQIANFSGEFMDTYPFVHPDGSRFFFQSNRPVDRQDFEDEWNIWAMDRGADGWSEPYLLPAPINGDGGVSGPSVTLDGTLYYTKMGENGDGIFRSRLVNGEYSTPERLPEEVNSTDAQFDGCISPDESFMVLPVYGREDTFGSTDLYVTFRTPDDRWSPLQNLGSLVNTQRTEGAPTITPDGNYLFFGRSPAGFDWVDKRITYADLVGYHHPPGYGSKDIYWVEISFVEALRPNP